MALFKGSRYAAVPPFHPDAEGRAAFRGVGPRPLPAAEAVLEHPIATGNRLDGLAHDYYREPRAWRRFAEANPDTLFSEDLLWRPVAEVTDDETGEERLGETLLVPRRDEGRR